MKRKFYTRKARDKLLTQFHKGDFRSPTQFAKEHGVHPTTFAKWLTNTRKLKQTQPHDDLRFVAVEEAPTSSAVIANAVIELRVREVSLQLPTTISAAFLAELVAILTQRRSC